MELKNVREIKRPSFTVDAQALREALELGTPEKKTTIPILVNALFEPHGKTLRITTTDLDQATVTEIDAILSKHKTHEAFTIPWRKTLDLLSGETGLVVFTPLENNWIRMTVSGVDYKLIGMATTNYPEVPEPTAPLYQIPGDTFTEMLAHTTFAISNVESRYTLNGAQFQFNNGKMRIAATDGHRAAIETREMDIKVKDGETHNIVVSKAALSWLSKPKRIGKEFVGISTEPAGKLQAQSFFHLPHLRTVFSTRVLSGQFPNIEAVMPRRDAIRVTANFNSAEAFSKLLVRVAKFADERSGCVRFNFDGKVALSAQSTDSGEALAEVPATLTGTEEDFAITIGLNSNYVLDVLKVIGKKPVTIHLKDEQSAPLIESSEFPGYSYILMPMRL